MIEVEVKLTSQESVEGSTQSNIQNTRVWGEKSGRGGKVKRKHCLANEAVSNDTSLTAMTQH